MASTLLWRAGRLPRLPSYVDSPMAIDATEIYRAHPEDTRRPARAAGSRPLTAQVGRLPYRSHAGGVRGSQRDFAPRADHLRQRHGDRRPHPASLATPPPRSPLDGLARGISGGRHAGARARGGRAHRPRSSATTCPCRGRTSRRCPGCRAHADADGLLRWLRTARRPPRRLFVVHGEPEPAAALAGRVTRELGWNVTVPAYRDRVTIA